MIVSSLKKINNSIYEVEIEDNIYKLTEESVLKYRLFKGYEISKEVLDKCIKDNDFEIIKNKAYSYYLRYQKNSYEIINYLKDRNVNINLAKDVVNTLLEEKKIDEYILALNAAESLARASNGKYLIKYKLKARNFKEDIIALAIDNINEDDINYGYEKLIKKLNDKYHKLNDYEKKYKIKDALFRHGYNVNNY